VDGCLLHRDPYSIYTQITLLELGTCLHRKGPIFIGTDPSYIRRFDVIVQSQLVRGKNLVIYDDVDIMVTALIQSVR
jgi:hypothetical protein